MKYPNTIEARVWGRYALFSDVKIRQYFDPCDKGIMYALLHGDEFVYRTVHTHADKRLVLKRLDMYIARAGAVSAPEQRVEQTDHRRIVRIL